MKKPLTELSDIQILAIARDNIEAYVDMGHFRNPKEATPYLIDGFQLGYRHMRKERFEERLEEERFKLIDRVRVLEEQASKAYDEETLRLITKGDRE